MYTCVSEHWFITMCMRTQIWKTYQNSVYKSFVIGEIISFYQERGRWTSIIIAIASSGSIATWAIWTKYPMLWGGIIALSQIVSSIKPYFPYNKYLNELQEKKNIALKINLDFERLWYKVQYDKITDEESGQKLFLIKEQMNKAYNFKEDINAQRKDSIVRLATERTEVYFNINYYNHE